MQYKEMYEKVKSLPFNTMTYVYSNQQYQVSIYRPSVLSERFSSYNADTNFQIYLKIGEEQPFRPSHLKLLLDLNLCIRIAPHIKDKMLLAFDQIFYGTDPIESVFPLMGTAFPSFVMPLDIMAVLAQLFLIEQNIGYGNRSKFNPPSLYIQGWIRAFIDCENEIDKVVYSICRYNPPSPRYTCQDDRNHPKYAPQAPPLWYKQ